jgi:glycosyltransferase involved in cell wall biosynthesis
MRVRGSPSRERRAQVPEEPSVTTVYSVGEGHHDGVVAEALGAPVVTTVWPAWAASLGGQVLVRPRLAAMLTRGVGALEYRARRSQDLTLTLTRRLHGRFSASIADELGATMKVATWQASDGVGFAGLRSDWCVAVAARSVAAEVAAADVVVAMSSFALNEMRDAWPFAQLELVLPGVDPKPTPRTSGGRALVYIGPIERQKGFGDLLDALEGQPRIELICAGPSSRHSAALLRRLEALPSARYLGVLDPGSRDELLAGAHVVVVPSHHEGFGLVILEAMAVGTPVIATTSTGAPDAGVDEFGWLVPPGHPDALREAVREACAMSDRERRWRGEAAFACLCERLLTTAAFVRRWKALVNEMAETESE